MEQRQRALEGLEVTFGFWSGRRVLITGHTGFKGAWLSFWLGTLGAEVTGMALAPDTEPNLWTMLEPHQRVRQLLGDVRDRDAVRAVFASADPEVVLHLAAQSLVSRGYQEPADTFAVNVQGTANVLEAARACSSVQAIVVVTSDKVYDHRQGRQPYDERSSLGGSDPYSASKACSELVVDAYRESYFGDGSGTGIATARAGNVIGGGDWSADRVVPDLVRALGEGTKLVLRSPTSTRPWQHVLDPLHGYLLMAERLATTPDHVPPALNFGPPAASCVGVSELVTRLGNHWRGAPGWVHDRSPRPPEAQALAISSTRATELLGWHTVLALDEALAWTARWYEAHWSGSDVAQVTHDQIEQFERLCQ